MPCLFGMNALPQLKIRLFHENGNSLSQNPSQTCKSTVTERQAVIRGDHASDSKKNNTSSRNAEGPQTSDKDCTVDEANSAQSPLM